MSNSHWRDGKLRCSAVLAVAASCWLSSPGGSAETESASNGVPGLGPVQATNAPGVFRIKPGFRLERVAADPAVTAPVAMAFDENGRLFVVERRDGPGRNATNAPSGRIRLLEDTEGQGAFDVSTIYADDLPRASALACYGGGVFVLAAPDLIYLRDTRTNGVADVRKVIFSGFGGTNAVDALVLPNNLNWGLDNRIHGASAGVAGLVPASTAPDAAPVSLASADFSFDPRTLTLCAEAGPAQSGLSFDDWGRKFTCDWLSPLRTPMYEPHYLARNPFFPAPPATVELANPGTAVFQFLSAEGAPPADLRLRVTNETAVAATLGTNALVATWLTNAQGCVVYRGSAFPSNYLGNVFVADASAHIIHRFVLRQTGLELNAVRAPDETNTEFVASADPAFRPVQIVNGPEGALYVVDRRDADERGRIYRLVPAGFKRPKPPRLGQAKADELVATLSHPNGWERDTAARLLYQRRDPDAVRPLESLLVDSRVPLTRMHVLHALDGLGALTQTHVLYGLQDTDARVREHAVLLSEGLAKGGPPPDAVWNQLRLLAADPSIRVRCQLAFTVGELRRPDGPQVLAVMLARDPTNLWMQTAIQSSLAEGAGNLFAILAGDARVVNQTVGQDWLLQLAAMIGVRGRPGEAAQVLDFTERLAYQPQAAFALLYALGDGLHWARSSLARADPQMRLQPLYSQAAAALQNVLIPESLRIAGIEVLGVAPFTLSSIGDVLVLQLGSSQSEAFQSAVLATLGRFDDPRVAPALIRRWRVLTPRARSEAYTALLSRADRLVAVLTALENGNVGAADLSSEQVDFLRTYRDPAIRQRALQFFGPVPMQRPQAVQRFRPALSLEGTPARGRDIFRALCAACHSASRGSQAFGPQLASVRIYGKENILRAILEPNAEVRRDYLTYVLETVWGEALTGLLRNENPITITIEPSAGGPVVLPRLNIQYLQAQSWSLMPESLDDGLTPQDMADLLEYVMTGAR